ncbi:MAG: tail fiber domain-containing protein [Ferruginibacter sp.]
MKKLFSFLFSYFLFLISYSQNIGIGTTTPNTSAVLDISSTSKGLLIPRMTTTQMNAIASPAVGLMVFNMSDSIFYVRKNSGWTKLIQTGNNEWAMNAANIYNSNTGNVGIGTSSPVHARMEVNGSVGAAVAIFGADKYGVAIEANNPEVGFNYFYNNGAKTIKAGYAAVIGMNPGGGEVYIGNFGGKQSSADFGAIDESNYKQNIILYQTGEIRLAGSANFSHFYNGSNEDTYIRGGKNGSKVIINDITGGKVGIGIVNPTRAILEQNGSVGTTAAIFGGDGAGISLQKNWPVIGFNHYFDGSVHRSIGQGYSGVFGINQDNGNLYYGGWNYSAVPNAALAGYSSKFNVTRSGNVGIGTTTPEADITISTPGDWTNSPTEHGLRFNYTGGGTDPAPGYWNLISNSITLFFYNNGTNVSFIRFNGEYVQPSDKNLKDNIENLSPAVLSSISLLKPVSYFMKADKLRQKRSYGFLAQDVEEVFPDFVHTENNLKGIAYQNFIPVLTRGIQEQQQQIEALKNENKSIKAELDELKKIIFSKK